MSQSEAVWQAMYDAERLGRYYGTMAERYRWGHYGTRLVLFVAAVAGASRLVESFAQYVPAWMPEAMSFVIVVLVTVDFMGNFGTKATVLHSIAIEFCEYEVRLRQLWASTTHHTSERTTEEIEAMLQNFELAMVRSTARAGYADISENGHVAESSDEDAKRVISNRYATEGTHSV